jgi:hypothetical protein
MTSTPPSGSCAGLRYSVAVSCWISGEMCADQAGSLGTRNQPVAMITFVAAIGPASVVAT